MTRTSRAAAAALSALGLGLGTVACGTATPSVHRSSAPVAGVRLPCAARARDVLARAAAVGRAEHLQKVRRRKSVVLRSAPFNGFHRPKTTPRTYER